MTEYDEFEVASVEYRTEEFGAGDVTDEDAERIADASDTVAEAKAVTEDVAGGVEEPVIHAFGYDAEGVFQHAKIRGFEPYFYVSAEDAKEATFADYPEVKRVETWEDTREFTSVRGERVIKVVTRHPHDVREIRDDFSDTYEDDVLFPTRFLIDSDITSGIRVPAEPEYADYENVEATELHADWRVHVVDIEVDDRHGFPRNGDQPILCITAYDSFDEEYVTWIVGDPPDDPADAAQRPSDRLHDAPLQIRWFDDEVEMLRSYLAYVSGSKPSIITGWNVDGFDLPYLKDRCDVLDADLEADAMSPLHDMHVHDRFGPTVRGTVVLDLLRTYKSSQLTEKESYRLDAVAADEIGVEKAEYVGTIGDLWEDDPAALIDYNLRDVELCVELDRREKLIEFAKEVKRFVGCEQEDAIISSIVADRYLLKTCHGDVVLPPQHSREGDDFEGAVVFDAADGLYEWVATLDLASLYPMSMLTLNASPETKVDPDAYDGPTVESPNGIHFRQDKPGITRDVIFELLNEREDRKEKRNAQDPDDELYDVYDRQQAAIKVIMNSLYGVMAWTKFRLYDVDVASAVTATGRAVIEETGEVAESIGRPVLYGDTDSVLLDVQEYADAGDEDGIVRACTALERQINAAYDDFAEDVLGADEHWFDIEFEKLYRRFFQAGKKKRYAGLVVWNEGKDVEDVSITGFEYKRSDCAPLTSEVQHETIKRIVEGAAEDEVLGYVRDQYDAFQRKDVSIADIGIPGGVGKDLHDYTADYDGQHAPRAAKMGNLLAGTSLARDSKPKRYYLDGVNPALFERVEREGLDPDRDAAYRQFKRDPDVIGVDQPEQLPAEVRLDWDEMERKTLRLPIQRVLDGVGIPWEDVENRSEQSGLGAFA